MGLVHFDKARQELAIAKTIDEVKEIRDRALAYRAYVKQIGESLEMQNMIAEIKIRAERKAGELLKEQDKNDGGKPMQKLYQSNDTTGIIEQPKYADDFTIRWSRPSGVDTEYQKIIKGLVDYILYGFIDQGEEKIISYFIGDLKVFRDSGVKPFQIKPNNPPDSEFAIFRLKDFPQDFVIKKWQK